MAMPAHPVVVVPGITATYLADEYPLPPQVVWSVLTKAYPRVALHPDNVRYEALEPARVTPGQVFEVAYKELVSELRHSLRKSADQPTPVYPFGYDWRQPLEHVEDRLLEFIDEVIDRARLLKHYHNSAWRDNPKVNLVGHSMGGLIIAGCLARHPGAARVAKVATLASPYRGSLEAPLKITTGTADLGDGDSGSRDREAARMTPALYYLLPSFEGAVAGAPGIPNSLFKAGAWQPSVQSTITAYVRRHSVEVGARGDESAEDRAARLFKAFRDAAADHRARIEGLSLASAGLSTDDWLCVVGVGSETRVRLRIDKNAKGAPEFQLGSGAPDGLKDRDNQWGLKGFDNPNRRRTGDGTVPFEGGVPGFLEEPNLVCVSPKDYGYWEIGDRVLSGLAGFHGVLPNMDMLHRLIMRHFTGAPDRHRNTWGRPAPGVSKEDWRPPLKLDAKE